jgi:molybdate transport system substrate-binding protein
MKNKIKGISSMATRQLLAELAQAFELHSGESLEIEAVGGVDAAQRVMSGEAFDVVFLAANAINKLIDASRVLPGSKVDLVQSGVAVAVRAGAMQPDIATEAALREAVRNAPSLAYSTGPSGVALAQLFERWGIAREIASRIVQAPPGVPVGELVAKGQAALGFQQLSELIHLSGITVVGSMPPAIQIITTFSGGVCSSCEQADKVRALLDFMNSPESVAAKHRQGMMPA